MGYYINEIHLFIKTGKRLIQLELTDIVLIEGSDNHIVVLTRSGAKHISQNSLKRIEEDLPIRFFCRVHRSYIISIPHIRYIHDDVINMGSVDVPLNKTYHTTFMEKLKVI